MMNAKLLDIKEFIWANPKELGFAVLLGIFALVGVYKSTPPMVKSVFELKISQNKKPIRSLFQERELGKTKTVSVDKLMLKKGSLLRHPKLGAIGFAGNYFIDVEATFTAKIAGVYYFIPGSDDGFSLDVNGKRLCSFAKDRPYKTQRCRVTLNEGENTFKLSYFQGGGHAGLTLAYQHKDDKKRRWVGENSKYLSFY